MTAGARRVLCLCGSLRRVSSNRAALEAARQLAQAETPSRQRKLESSDFESRVPKALDASVRRHDEPGGQALVLQLYDGLATLPLFNPDDERDPLPPAVLALREAVGQADALLVACPEYAHGVPGAFKNLLDWLVGSLEFPGKPVLLLNTSARSAHHAQAALAEILRTMSVVLLSAQPMPVALPGAGCTVEQVLAHAQRCVELRAALDVLATALAAADPSAAAR